MMQQAVNPKRFLTIKNYVVTSTLYLFAYASNKTRLAKIFCYLVPDADCKLNAAKQVKTNALSVCI